MVLSKKPHDKGAADVYTVPRLKTPIEPVVSVDLLPRGDERKKIKPKWPNSSSSSAIRGTL